MKKNNSRKMNLTFLNWLILPAILMYVSINYMLSNVIEPRWQVFGETISGFPTHTSYAEKAPSIPEFSWEKTGLVTFWFDDAWLSQYTAALPILEKYNFKGSIAVPTQQVGFENYMNWYQLKRTQYLGWEITAHSRTHSCDTDPKPQSVYESEVLGSKEDLSKVGLRNDIYVLPCGIEREEVTKLAKDNYRSLRTIHRGLNSIPVTEPYSLKIVQVDKFSTLDTIQAQINEAKRSHKWILLTFHQVSDETSEYAVSPEMFEEVVKGVAKSGLPVVLPSQVLNIK